MILKVCCLSFIILGGCVVCREPSEIYGDLRYATVVSQNPIEAAQPWVIWVNRELAKRRQPTTEYQSIFLLKEEQLVDKPYRTFANFSLNYELVLTNDGSDKYVNMLVLNEKQVILDNRYGYVGSSIEWCQRVDTELFANGSGLKLCSREWMRKVTQVLKESPN